MTAPAHWLIGGASVRGPAHVRTNRPNQDAVGWSPASGSGSRVVAAVSDGHGARPHFRSGDGARFAVDSAVDVIAWHMDDREDQHAVQDLAGALAAAWRGRVDRHLADHPYDDVERIIASSQLSPYGATLLTMGADTHALTMMQIGDGDLLLGHADGRIVRPLQADEGLVGEQTYSLCHADAEAHFRIATIWHHDHGDWPDFAMLASDGVSKSFRDDGTFDDAVARLRLLALSDWPALMAALPGWLADVAEHGSGDDSTICLIARPSRSIS